ncbi:ChuX/HutX family heme-like substrate-binding protein [Neolewinella lacunae]|uniref:Hemin-degrading factor n=1 Tax=Neolewinella lacunae TaxID=1517758 RepID=A0A923PJQ6_9BACT|nr:ChuX/HutX family heme-like substrate-binding protein [Neolewinella lacunae]MBC6992986.1 hemin-degrading factor [Neolewinella lacunae]MDN3635776.1 ChuX/HutX family heme-like substrate-binding protein [Neolewinella lacunae]
MKDHTLHLRERLEQLRTAEPQLRARDQAERLGISEAELVSLGLGENVIRLGGDFKALLKDVLRLGHVMALTRNDHVVHERKGVYDNITFYDGPHNMGVAVNPDIDLRLFMNEWVYGLAVIMRREKGGDLHGLQFFNARGEAVHKIYTTPQSDMLGWAYLIEKYTGPQEAIILENREAPSPEAERPDEEVELDIFQDEWRNLKDTHHFFGLLRKHQLTRTQALRLAPAGMVTPVDRLAVEQILTAAAERAVPIMCFVHSSGCIQIHSGPVKHLKWMGKWFNVLDPAFNLHLDTEAIATAYVVRKPTEDGIVTSLELFDDRGEMITYFFGARKPGQPELPEWTEILENLTATASAH